MPLHIGEAALCKEVSRRLLDEFGMYATPINYPTVPRGEERLRFTPGPLHTDAMMDGAGGGAVRDHSRRRSERLRERLASALPNPVMGGVWLARPSDERTIELRAATLLRVSGRGWPGQPRP